MGTLPMRTHSRSTHQRDRRFARVRRLTQTVLIGSGLASGLFVGYAASIAKPYTTVPLPAGAATGGAPSGGAAPTTVGSTGTTPTTPATTPAAPATTPAAPATTPATTARSSAGSPAAPATTPTTAAPTTTYTPPTTAPVTTTTTCYSTPSGNTVCY